MSLMTDLPTSVRWLHDQTEEELDLVSTRATARFWMPWSDRLAFLRIVAGLPQQFTVGTASITRIVPLQYPFYSNVFANRVHLVGEGSSRLAGDGASIDYDWAMATVWFSTPQWRIDGPFPLCTETSETNADITTRPNTAYKFPSDGAILNQNVGVLVPVTEFTLTFYQLPAYNKTLYASLSGYVNSATFYDYAAGTVQYIGPAIGSTIYNNNSAAWTVTHRFRWRSIEHNEIMRPDGNGFEAPVSVYDGTTKLLPAADLNLLWAN